MKRILAKIFSLSLLKRLLLLLLAFFYVAGFAALACSVAACFGYASWFCDLLADARVYYCWYFLLVIVLTLLTKQRVLLCLWVAGLALNLGNLCWIVAARPLAPVGPSIRLMQMNIERGNRSFAKVINCIQKENPDVIAFQELQPPMAAKLTAALSQYKHSYFVSDEGYGGMGILSKYLLSKSNQLAVTGGFPVLSCDVETPIGKIAVYDIHPFTPILSPEWRAQRTFFSAVSNACSKETNPVVVVGDYNSTPMSIRFKDFLADTHLVDAQAGFGWQPTWKPIPELTDRIPLSNFLMIPIDHCFIAPELVCTSRFTCDWVDSDHLPLVTVLAHR